MGDITLRFILGRVLRWRVLSFLMFLFIIIYPLVVWGKLPARLALQISLSGTPINYVAKGFAYALFVYGGIVLLGMNLFFDIRTVKIMWRDTKNKTRWYIYLPISDVFYALLAYIMYNTMQFNINQLQAKPLEIWRFFLFWGLPVGVISLLNSRVSSKGQEGFYRVEERIIKELGQCLYHDKQDNHLGRWCCIALFGLVVSILFFLPVKIVGILILFLFIPIYPIILSRMNFLIYEHAVVIEIGIPKLYRKVIPIDTIKEVYPRTFKPIQEFLGWGIRQSVDGTHGYFEKGNRGLFILTETSKWLLGFNNPEEAAEIVRKQMKVPAE